MRVLFSRHYIGSALPWSPAARRGALAAVVTGSAWCARYRGHRQRRGAFAVVVTGSEHSPSWPPFCSLHYPSYTVITRRASGKNRCHGNAHQSPRIKENPSFVVVSYYESYHNRHPFRLHIYDMFVLYIIVFVRDEHAAPAAASAPAAVAAAETEGDI